MANDSVVNRLTNDEISDGYTRRIINVIIKNPINMTDVQIIVSLIVLFIVSLEGAMSTLIVINGMAIIITTRRNDIIIVKFAQTTFPFVLDNTNVKIRNPMSPTIIYVVISVILLAILYNRQKYIKLTRKVFQIYRRLLIQ